ncbi:hypothetical protein EJA01_13015 [Rhodovulum iodosum]|nr:hypothetical protein EJA01_13015 [Rhodovulum robiginosum]
MRWFSGAAFGAGYATRPCTGSPGDRTGTFETGLATETSARNDCALSLARHAVAAEDLVRDCMVRTMRSRQRFTPAPYGKIAL